MKKILITGATDGIGYETAKMLVDAGHQVLLHGRNADKLNKVSQQLSALPNATGLESYRADLSSLEAVIQLAAEVSANHSGLDVLINNAGVYKVAEPLTQDGLDTRFAVNSIAPYLLTRSLLPLLRNPSRVINLSSAAQSPVSLAALRGDTPPASDDDAYAQSKLALTMWSCELARLLGNNGPAVIAINPGSFLGTNMVREAYGVEGKDLLTGARMLVSAALDARFENASGRYFDNDSGDFASPHPDALDAQKRHGIMMAIDSILLDIGK